MSRRLASPEAETMSYWSPPPERMSSTISSDDPAYFWLIVQPDCFSNGFTHWGCRYPSHAIMFSVPPPVVLLTPAAGTASATAITAIAPRIRLLISPPVRVVPSPPAERHPRHATRA